MKKLLSIVLILVLSLSCFSLASCDKEEFTKEQLEAYENYTNALKKTNELDDLDGKLDMIISMNVQGTQQTVSYNFNMKASGATDPKAVKMRLGGKMNLSGQNTVMDCYMENSWAYYDMNVSGQKVKFKTNLADGGNSYSELFNAGNVDLPKSLFKKVAVTEQSDGSKLLELTLSGKQLLSLYTDLAANLGTDFSASDISDASVNATVNKDGYLSKTTVSYTMMIQGISAKLTLTVEYFNLGKSVTVEPIEGYQSFPEQIIGG
ncbi:MAG: hypothetical protein IJY94_05365 [Clostridia bacterium]|nr:hypothetical protein [Clostridia bacterium]